jgi:ATP-dependent RNA helicase RhlE
MRGAGRPRVLVPPRRASSPQEIEDDLIISRGTSPSVAVYGGVGANAQAQGLRAPADFVVATPGRLLDHMRAGIARFEDLEVLVLDEADRMLDMGFWPDVRRIVSDLPVGRQTLFFSATMSDDVFRSAAQIMRDPRIVRVGGGGGVAENITHCVRHVGSDDKATWLAAFLHRSRGSALVFTRTSAGPTGSAGAGHRRRAVRRHTTDPGPAHRGVEGFRSGRFTTLVATDIAARGLDIDGIAHVVNYDVPDSADSYIHRVGRTARAETTGIALTLVAVEEQDALRIIERSLKIRLQDAQPA